MFIRIFADVTGFGRFQLSQLGLILLDSRAVGDGDASRAELFIDAAQAGLGRFQVSWFSALALSTMFSLSVSCFIWSSVEYILLAA